MEQEADLGLGCAWEGDAVQTRRLPEKLLYQPRSPGHSLRPTLIHYSYTIANSILTH